MTAPPKSRVLFMPEGSVLAHVGRCLAIARELDRERCDIFFAASGDHASKIEREGWPLEPVHTCERNELLSRLKAGGSAFVAEELREYVKDERRILSREKWNLVIGDFRPSLGISAVSLKVPYVCITNAIWTRYCTLKFNPPASWPPTKKFGAWPLKIARFLAPSIEQRIYAHYAEPFNIVRRECGLPGLADVRDCMCSENFNLVADHPKFFPAEFPRTFEYVGPIFWTCDRPVPEWLAKLDRNRRIVYLTMGSTGPLERMADIAQSLVSNGLQVICTTATGPAVPQSEYIHADAFAPGKALCEKADVVVCHAGNGTIFQALSCGKPIVGVPEFHDQDFNMQRVEKEKVGLRARPDHLPEDVVRQVRKILDHPGYSDEAKAWQKRLEEASKSDDLNGSRAAARWIEKVACPGAIRSGPALVSTPSQTTR